MDSTNLSDSLENQLLIAMPRLQDPYFANTVTYLWKHNNEGALGIIVNKPLRTSLADIFDELKISWSIGSDPGPFKKRNVLAGGPVERERGFIVHEGKADPAAGKSLNIQISTSRDMLQEIANGNGPQNYLIALGCAGWEAGQLEKEISENAWLTAPATLELIFSDDFANKAANAAAQLGVNLNHLSPATGHS